MCGRESSTQGRLEAGKYRASWVIGLAYHTAQDSAASVLAITVTVVASRL